MFSQASEQDSHGEQPYSSGNKVRAAKSLSEGRDTASGQEKTDYIYKQIYRTKRRQQTC